MKVSGLRFMVAPPPVVSLGVTVHQTNSVAATFACPNILVRFIDGKEKQYDVKSLFKEITAFHSLAYVTDLFE